MPTQFLRNSILYVNRSVIEISESRLNIFYYSNRKINWNNIFHGIRFNNKHFASNLSYTKHKYFCIFFSVLKFIRWFTNVFNKWGIHKIKTYKNVRRYCSLMNEIEAKSYLSKLGVTIILIMTIVFYVVHISLHEQHTCVIFNSIWYSM